MLFRKTLFACLCLCAPSLASAQYAQKSWETIQEYFQTIPLSVRPNPLWFWNNTRVEPHELKKQIAQAQATGYGGLSILPFGKNFSPEYLSDEYFELYRVCIEEAKRLGMSLWLYDEYGFPSGSGGLLNADGISRFELKHPSHTIKRLDKEEYPVLENTKTAIAIPEGILMAAIAMDSINLRRIDISSAIKEGVLGWNVPQGNWKVLFFMCRPDIGIVDYMDKEAVGLYINMTHDEYYKRFKSHFGTTIVGTFFDEPTLYHAKGRSWTAKFNEAFENKYGFSPASYYPALWYDIGEETQQARNYLFGLRSELYAEGYTKQVNDWSRAHGVWATGHQDNEEVVNPVGTSGDLMKCFKYLDIPGIDKIGGVDRPAEKFYKIVSSAAYNWDHSMAMSETYGAMGNISWDQIYNIAMDQYVKGINLLIPHAVWYDTSMVVFKPELSSKSPIYGKGLPAYTDYLGRLNTLMQNDARWMGDIAILYPIQTMQGDHYMDGPLGHYSGGVEMADMDYIDLGVTLFDSLAHDFMFIHPEVLDAKCQVEGDLLILNNEVQYNSFSILMLPACKTISLSNLQKVEAFVKSGGKLIFTSQLPQKASLAKDDKEVRRIVDKMLSSKKERAIFVKEPTIVNIKAALKHLKADFDLRFTSAHRAKNVHKMVSGKNIWFFANTQMMPKDLRFELKGKYKLSIWDPHTGAQEKAKYSIVSKKEGITEVEMNMPANSSLFLIEQ
ncbi:hypothetical protein AwDysgo_06540 [Bacteroidales bacterium]|nr:hypothetical protein AwDysgo_06540 [Bacteroidales bacterium]